MLTSLVRIRMFYSRSRVHRFEAVHKVANEYHMYIKLRPVIGHIFES